MRPVTYARGLVMRSNYQNVFLFILLFYDIKSNMQTPLTGLADNYCQKHAVLVFHDEILDLFK